MEKKILKSSTFACSTESILEFVTMNEFEGVLFE